MSLTQTQKDVLSFLSRLARDCHIIALPGLNKFIPANSGFKVKIGFPLSVQYCLLCDPLMFYCCQSLNVAGCPLGIPGLLGRLPALRIPPPRILAQVPPSRFPPIFLQRIRNNYINAMNMDLQAYI